MPISLQALVRTIDPARTVLLFGAGASIPSGAPSVETLQKRFEEAFGISATQYTLAEQTGIIEQVSKDRPKMIRILQGEFKNTKPTGALLNLPLYKWKSIYTTNYDTLVEQAYIRKNIPIDVYTTNFDFSQQRHPDSVLYFKLHGTITEDVSLNGKSRIILTESDYDLTQEYREQVYDRFRSDLAGSHLIIIGHSLADPNIRAEINRILSINSQAGGSCRISLLMYTPDDGRAALVEARGAEVTFGGLDDFFAGLVAKIEGNFEEVTSPDPLDHFAALRPATHDALHLTKNQTARAASMYNGWPATYGDIAANLTFQRNIAVSIVKQLQGTERFVATILGPSGVGKTTAARQVVSTLATDSFFCWEHKSDQALQWDKWVRVAERLSDDRAKGVLFVDEADQELPAINALCERLHSAQISNLKILLSSTNHQWGPRVKSPSFFKVAGSYYLNKVGGEEIDRLLNLVEHNKQLHQLVERTFRGYSRTEQRRRMIQRCEADMFVCLKNIFSSESFDNIILREYASLAPEIQDVYKIIAAMESAGVHVHRQLVIRLLGIPSMQVSGVLARLEDIVHEQAVNEREGVYAWQGRHKVIMGIVAEHKYYSKNSRYELFSRVVDAISPAYDIEVRTIRNLCSVENGLATVADKNDQNTLLRKMISVANGERVPRHRLIRNLIELTEFDQAETEIKVFGDDFGYDAPVTRYRIKLAMARAIRSKGLMREDRIAKLGKAKELAAASATKKRYADSKAVLGAYCEVGIEIAKLTGEVGTYREALQLFKGAEERVGDPEMSQMISKFERRISRIDVEEPEVSLDDDTFAEVE